MDGTAIHCPNCGANVNLDIKTHKGICEWCGAVIYPRSLFNNDEKAQNELKTGLAYFCEANFEEAKKHLENVLAISFDNAPALFARAYYDEFISPMHNEVHLKEFFEKIDELDLEEDEVKKLTVLFGVTRKKLSGYEPQILKWALQYLSDGELENFAENFCPFVINERRTVAYFTKELFSLYEQLAKKCSAPKTVFALLQGIDKNPDSPIPNNEFFLKTKTKMFYENYVVPVGTVVLAMRNGELREKFNRVYQFKRTNYEKNI